MVYVAAVAARPRHGVTRLAESGAAAAARRWRGGGSIGFGRAEEKENRAARRRVLWRGRTKEEKERRGEGERSGGEVGEEMRKQLEMGGHKVKGSVRYVCSVQTSVHKHYPKKITSIGVLFSRTI